MLKFQNPWMMRKFLFGLIVVAVTALSVTSCKTHEKCPAYSKANTQSAHQAKA